MTVQRPWTSPKTIKQREHSNAMIDGHYVLVEIDEYGCLWYVSGEMFGVDCCLTGDLPNGATISDLRVKVEDVLRVAREGGFKP